MKQGFIVLISGPSGVGKGTLINSLLADKSLNLTFSVSMTTRKPRPNEKHGVHYFFVSHETFLENIERNNFLEHAQFVGNRYGTPRDYVYTLLNKGKNVLVEIEVDGACQLLNSVPKDQVLSLYIMPPTVEDLIKRLRHRGSEDEATIMQRAERFKEEVKYKDLYQWTIINDDLQTCIDEVKALIRGKINS
ncbi:MAG: Guanylate kinase [Tenericutes bacterium ADurb.Bin087]|nr:MAG: Guanylate kinase [Tenericutes bacterium ADurb.Bin087]